MSSPSSVALELRRPELTDGNNAPVGFLREQFVESFSDRCRELLNKAGETAHAAQVPFPVEYREPLARTLEPYIVSAATKRGLTPDEVRSGLQKATQGYWSKAPKQPTTFAWTDETHDKLARVFGPEIEQAFSTQVQGMSRSKLFSLNWERRRGDDAHYLYRFGPDISNPMIDGLGASHQPVSDAMQALAPLLKYRNRENRGSHTPPQDFPTALRAFYLAHEADYLPDLVHTRGDIGRALHYDTYALPAVRPETWKANRPRIAAVAGEAALQWADLQIIETGLRHLRGAFEPYDHRQVKGPVIDRIRASVAGPYPRELEDALVNYTTPKRIIAGVALGLAVDRSDVVNDLKYHESTAEVKHALLGALAYPPKNGWFLRPDDVPTLANKPWSNISYPEMASALFRRHGFPAEVQGRFDQIVQRHLDPNGFADVAHHVERLWLGDDHKKKMAQLVMQTDPRDAADFPAKVARHFQEPPPAVRPRPASPVYSKTSTQHRHVCGECGRPYEFGRDID